MDWCAKCCNVKSSSSSMPAAPTTSMFCRTKLIDERLKDSCSVSFFVGCQNVQKGNLRPRLTKQASSIIGRRVKRGLANLENAGPLGAQMGVSVFLLLSLLLTLCSAPTGPGIAVRSISALWRPRHFVADTSVSHKSCFFSLIGL